MYFTRGPLSNVLDQIQVRVPVRLNNDHLAMVMKEGKLQSREKNLLCVDLQQEGKEREAQCNLSTLFFKRWKSPILPLLSLFLSRLQRLFFPCCSYQFPGSTRLRWRDTFLRESAFSKWKSPCSSPWLTGCASAVLRLGLSMKGDGNILLQSTAPFRALLNLLVRHFLGESSHASFSCDLLNGMNYVKTQTLANTWKALVGVFLANYFIGSGSC